MTFDEYINNPMGIKSAVISNREMYRKMYTEKFDKVMVREVGKMDYQLSKSNSKYYCYLKVPSETVPNFYYDVVIEFSEPKDKKFADASLRNYDVKFFSNDPAFVFTFCYTFRKNKMFIDDYKEKMSPEALAQKPVEKNPTVSTGYVKSFYFAYLMMKKRNLFSKILYVNKYNKSNILKEIMPADKKIEARQNAAEDMKNKKRIAKNIDDAKRRQAMDKDFAKYIKKPSVVMNTIKTNTVKNTRKVNFGIKTTKKTKRK